MVERLRLLDAVKLAAHEAVAMWDLHPDREPVLGAPGFRERRKVRAALCELAAAEARA